MSMNWKGKTFENGLLKGIAQSFKHFAHSESDPEKHIESIDLQLNKM